MLRKYKSINKLEHATQEVKRNRIGCNCKVARWVLLLVIPVNGQATAIEQVECPLADCADLSVCNLLREFEAVAVSWMFASYLLSGLRKRVYASVSEF